MKKDLYFSKPYMNTAGSLGFSPDTRTGFSFDSFGAFVTNPFSLRPRLPTAHPAVIEYPGGFLLHTGLPNPGLKTGIHRYGHAWNKSAIPVIVHLMADRPEETRTMVQLLEEVENVMAVELGFAPLLADDILHLTLEMCLGELPLIFSLPMEQVLTLGPRLIQNGAQAISLSPPRGALANENDTVTTGRIFGPSLFPQTLEMVRSAARTGIPIIGSGGVWSKEYADMMLEAGAFAVQFDAALWDPSISF